jgi:hypothetical protein
VFIWASGILANGETQDFIAQYAQSVGRNVIAYPVGCGLPEWVIRAFIGCTKVSGDIASKAGVLLLDSSPRHWVRIGRKSHRIHVTHFDIGQIDGQGVSPPVRLFEMLVEIA